MKYRHKDESDEPPQNDKPPPGTATAKGNFGMADTSKPVVRKVSGILDIPRFGVFALLRHGQR